MTIHTDDAALVTIDIAIAPYRGVSAHMARRWIRIGRLPATKIGRAYLVSPADVAALLRPTLRQPAARPARESESAKIARQLRDAGIDAR